MPKRVNLEKTIFIISIIVSIVFLVWRLYTRTTESFEVPKTIDLVIARYKEPLEWLKSYKDYPFRRVYIYNKSDNHPECPITNCRIESIQNVGVCDHTYLYHILKVYDDPEQADMTVFLPASAESNSLKRPKIEKILKMAKRGAPSISAYKAHDKPEDDKLGGPGFYLDKWTVSDAKNRDSDDSQLVKANPRPFGKWYDMYFPGKQPQSISLLGMFAVTRDMIRSNPRSLYKSLIETVSYDKYPEAAHYVERSWATLFKDIPKQNYV